MAARSLLALALVALAACASAQSLGDTFTTHPLTDIPAPADGVTTAVWFPKHAGNQFEAGEVVEVVFAVRNAGKAPANLTYVMGSLNNAENFAEHFQNFSLASAAGVGVAPGGEASLSYYFRPDPSLPERDFQVALTAFYNVAGGEKGASTFFNRTISIVEPRRAVDWQLLQLLATFGVLGAGAAYAAYAWAVGAGVIKKPKRARAVAGAGAGAADQTEWLKGTFYGGAKPAAKKAA